MDGEGERQAAELEREIEETRDQLDQTFDELESRLSVDHLMAEVRGRLEGVAHSALDSIEQHPTLVIAGVAAAIFLMRRRQRARRAFGGIELTAADLLRLLEHRLDATTRTVDHSARETSRSLSDYIADAIQRAGTRVDHAARDTSHTLGDYIIDALRRAGSGMETARDKSHVLSEYAADAIDRAGKSLSEGAHLVHDRGEDLLRQFGASENRRPLSYGLLALALAVGIGLARSRAS
jgi:hypothetical protein